MFGKEAREPTRRGLLKTSGAALLTLPFLSRRAVAQDAIFLVSVPDAALEKFVIDDVAPIMKSRYGATIRTRTAASSGALSTLRAQRRAPTLIATTLDQSYAIQALQEDLVEPVSVGRVPHLADVTGKAKVADDSIVSFILSVDTLCYNTNAWQGAPKSYREVFQDGPMSKAAIPSPSGGIGFEFLAILSSMATGKPLGEAALEPEAGIDYLARYRDKFGMIYARTQEMMPLLANGDMSSCFTKTRFLADWIERKAPVDCTVPQEGAFYSLNCLLPVKGSPSLDMGMAFIDVMLSPAIQSRLASKIGSAPVNLKAESKIPDALKNVVPTPAQIDGLSLLPDLTPERVASVAKMFNAKIAR